MKLREHLRGGGKFMPFLQMDGGVLRDLWVETMETFKYPEKFLFEQKFRSRALLNSVESALYT